jgi:hypothetical protein
MSMTGRTDLFKIISILVVLVLPTLILLAYGLVLLASNLSALLISVNEWWLYLIVVALGICFLPLPPFSKKCASSFYKFYTAFVRRLFSKNPQGFVIQDKVEMNSCHNTAFDDPTADLPMIQPPPPSENELISCRCESLPSARLSVPPDPGHLISIFKSKFFFFKSFLAGCLFFIRRFLGSFFGMLLRIGGEIVHSGKLKIINYWTFR